MRLAELEIRFPLGLGSMRFEASEEQLYPFFRCDGQRLTNVARLSMPHDPDRASELVEQAFTDTMMRIWPRRRRRNVEVVRKLVALMDLDEARLQLQPLCTEPTASGAVGRLRRRWAGSRAGKKMRDVCAPDPAAGLVENPRALVDALSSLTFRSRVALALSVQLDLETEAVAAIVGRDRTEVERDIADADNQLARVRRNET